MREKLCLELFDAHAHAFDLGRQRACPRKAEFVRECEHPFRELVVLSEQVELAMAYVRELRGQRFVVGELLDGHPRPYRHGPAAT